MNAIRGIVRTYVVIALLIWTILVGIPIIFQGANVSTIQRLAGRLKSGS